MLGHQNKYRKLPLISPGVIHLPERFYWAYKWREGLYPGGFITGKPE